MLEFCHASPLAVSRFGGVEGLRWVCTAAWGLGGGWMGFQALAGGLIPAKVALLPFKSRVVGADSAALREGFDRCNLQHVPMAPFDCRQ